MEGGGLYQGSFIACIILYTCYKYSENAIDIVINNATNITNSIAFFTILLYILGNFAETF